MTQFGFKRDNTERIFIGFFDGNDNYRYGHRVKIQKGKMTLDIYYYKIDFPFTKCTIDMEYVAEEDKKFIYKQ